MGISNKQLDINLRRYSSFRKDESGRIIAALEGGYKKQRGRMSGLGWQDRVRANLGEPTWSGYQSWLKVITVGGPAPSPVPTDIEARKRSLARHRQKSRRHGRRGTIITEGGLGGKGTTLLGGSA